MENRGKVERLRFAGCVMNTHMLTGLTNGYFTKVPWWVNLLSWLAAFGRL